MNTAKNAYYIAAFLTAVNGTGNDWQLNLSSVGEWLPGSGWSYGNSDKLKNEWQTLQKQGSSMIVSFGGSTFNPGSTITADTIDELAQAVAYSFLGGASVPAPDSPYANWSPVFSDWHFDGLDLDLEISAYTAADNATWLAFAQAIKKYAPTALLTGAPQSPYLYNNNVSSPFGVPFPNAAMDTCGNGRKPLSGDFLLSTTNIGLFDALLVQFYNQGAANDFPTEANFNARICQLATLITSSADNKTKIFIGVATPNDIAIGNNGNTGCISCNNAMDIGNAISTALAAAGGSNSSTWFGGVMGWDSPTVNSFVQDIIEVCGGDGALYGYQNGNPGWT